MRARCPRSDRSGPTPPDPLPCGPLEGLDEGNEIEPEAFGSCRAERLDLADIKTISFCVMPSLQVRNIPDDLYEALRATADKEGRSLSAQTVAILRRALADSLVDRAGVARRVAARRRAAGVMTRSAQELVREDRDR